MRISTRIQITLAACAVPLICSGAHAASNELGWTLDSVLAQLQRQTSDFKTALADVEATWRSPGNTEPTRVRSGRLYINADGVLRFAEPKPEGHTILVTKNEVHEHDSVRALVERYSLSKHKTRLEPYARLGFTTTGKDLRDNYLVTLLGEDHQDGRRLVGLELTPKKDREREQVARIQLWIDQASWMPTRQEIAHVASGDTLTITYSGLARNLKLSPDLFKAKWPRGTQKIRR